MTSTDDSKRGQVAGDDRKRARLAERLRATFPEARILLVFREQRALIRSMYSQHITDGGVESLGRFLDTPEPRLGRKPSFNLAVYEFDRLIALYRQLFGPDQVLALPVELLEDSLKHATGHLGAASDVVSAVHEDFRLDDRHQAGLLGQCGEP